MPTAPLRPCNQPGCPELVSKGRCQPHERKRDQERGTAHERGYGHRWREYRIRFLREHPLCAPCEQGGRIEAATVVDHVKDHKGDEQLFWDPRNHRAVCRPCHDKRVDAGDFGR